MARVYRISLLLSLSCLLQLGCGLGRPRAREAALRYPISSPLPAFHREAPERVLPALVEAAESRVDLNLDRITLWRRIAQIHYALGQENKATAALLTGAALADDTLTRSLIADTLLQYSGVAHAKQALAEYGYLGESPALKQLAQGAKLTEAERKRLEAPVFIQRGPNSGLQVFPTRLVMQLVLRGADKEARALLKPRLDFALRRGRAGGRTQSFHDAILCTFFLGEPERALEATERELPYWRMQTLFCLLLGGATDVDQILFGDSRVPERDVDPRLVERLTPALRATLIRRLKRVLPEVPVTRPKNPATPLEYLDDPASGRITLLCALLGEWELAQEAAEKIQNTEYRRQCQRALVQRQLPLFAPLILTPSVSALGALSQNLSRISRMPTSPHTKRLLQQAIDEARARGQLAPLADYIAQVAWAHGVPELILPLLKEETPAWFKCSQALKLARSCRERGLTSDAAGFLADANAARQQILKNNQKGLLGLDTAEEARLQGDLALCDALRRETQGLLAQLTTSTIRAEVALRLLRLHGIRADRSAFDQALREVQALITSQNKSFPAEADRLRIELALRLEEAGQRPESLRALQEIQAGALQAQALCTYLENTLRLSQPPRSYPTPKLSVASARAGRG